MKHEFDVIIIGGGIAGLATAYYLAKQKQNVLVLEKSYIGSGSTGRCISGIRAQFSTETSIKLAMHSIKLFQQMDETFGFSIEWTPSGYLFLAHEPARKQAFAEVLELQQRLGLDVQLLEKKEIQQKFPYLLTDELLAATYCPTDGQADPFKVLKGYFQAIKAMGSTILTRTEVVGIDVRGDLKKVTTANGDRYSAPSLLIAAGPWAQEVGQMVGLDLAVFPERHEALITEPVQYVGIPMIVDYRKDGGYFVQRITGQVAGCYTPHPNIPGHDVSSSFEFLTEMSRRMMRLVPALENLAVVRQWAGSYSMTPDGNPIVDETDIPGIFVSVGMCGHGFMLGPGLGDYLAQFIIHREWPMDMTEFAFKRDFSKASEALA